MKVSTHVKISGVLSLGVYACTSELVPSLACFLSGWLLDIDHFLDWVMNFGPTRNCARVVKNFEKQRLRRVYVILHGWEYVIGLFAIHILYGLPQWAAYATLGYTCHLTLDQIFNGPKRPLTYFLAYRISHKFNAFFLIMRGSTSTPLSVLESK